MTDWNFDVLFLSHASCIEASEGCTAGQSMILVIPKAISSLFAISLAFSGAVLKLTLNDQLALIGHIRSWHKQGSLLLVHLLRYTAVSYAMQVTLQTYRIIPPVLSGVNYNVRIQLESSEGHAGFYCNPSWGGQPDESSTIAQPKNAIWYTGVTASVPLPSCVDVCKGKDWP